MIEPPTASGLPLHRAQRVVRVVRQGSSLPLVIDTGAGRFLTKLRGAAQGTTALVAEIIVAGLADLLGLPVPRRVLVSIDAGTECDDRDAEVQDLLRASFGINLGFEFFDDAHDLRHDEASAIDAGLASQIVWLDGLVLNPDRTVRNPNILRSRQRLWLIDHGAALPFQHDWSRVTEDSSRWAGAGFAQHALLGRATRVAAEDDGLTRALTREALHHVTTQVPDTFLQPLLPEGATPMAIERRRQAYAAFLWKRLKPPRPFVELSPFQATVPLRATALSPAERLARFGTATRPRHDLT